MNRLRIASGMTALALALGAGDCAFAQSSTPKADGPACNRSAFRVVIDVGHTAEAPGAQSARGMLLTLLGEFVLPAEGVAWTSAVLAAFERLGVAEKATRQALMRTSNAGWLKPDKVGRRTRWQLTPAARRLLTDGAERIYSFGPAHDWDGTWVLVQVRIPDSDRRTRHEVRTRLAWAGYGSLGPGLWISPHSGRQQEAVPSRIRPKCVNPAPERAVNAAQAPPPVRCEK